MAAADALWTVSVQELMNGEVQISVDNEFWLPLEHAKRLAAQLQVVLDAIATVYASDEG